jgi:hypothetical protein
LRIDIHQADRAILQTWCQQDIAAEVSGENQASSTNKGNLRHNYFYSDTGPFKIKESKQTVSKLSSPKSSEIFRRSR